VEKQCLLMKTFGWTPDYVMEEITGAQGWVYRNWALENEATMWGESLVRRTPGYVRQEMEKG
jgi:hypothetical protein